MKTKSALKQSKRSIRPHIIFVVLTSATVALWQNWLTILALSVSLLSLIIDAVNIFYITRKVKRDPNYLESKVE